MTYCFVVTALALVGSTNKRFGRYAILKNLSLRSPSILMTFHEFVMSDTTLIFLTFGIATSISHNLSSSD